MNSAQTILAHLFNAAVRSVSPQARTKNFCNEVVKRASSRIGSGRAITVVGFGKAACSMAEAAEEELTDTIERGVIITKYSHHGGYDFQRTTVYEAGHPIPDENGVRATEHLMDAIRESRGRTMILCLISGGGSALLVAPCEGITLEEKRKTTDLLLRSGADIHEVNTVRKHLSRIKGGRLARLAFPSPIVSLILSDVIGDEIDTIASGPTAPDATTFDDALSVLHTYDLTEQAPPAVVRILREGVHGRIPETPKKDDPIFRTVQNIVIGSNGIALRAVAAEAERLGFPSRIISESVSGEARDVGVWLGSVAREARQRLSHGSSKRACLISGGETTVTVKGNGIGGRNMEVALSFALHIDGIPGITLLSAGTDGNDGPTDAAGALVDGQTIQKARSLGLDPRAYLDNNDSYTFFARIGGLFMTGPTGTNVMDVQTMLIEHNG